ncbi:MAG: hypothetical protein EXR66_01505 [Dehalococcoidia bacterium]|nr:hypothetical protein [Dehalococcoidia bacterium]
MRIVQFRDRAGREPVTGYFERLAREGFPTVTTSYTCALVRLADVGPALGMPYAKMIDSRARLYELRIGAHRSAYAVIDGEIVLLHVWRKRSQKLDDREVAIALRRLDDARMRW